MLFYSIFCLNWLFLSADVAFSKLSSGSALSSPKRTKYACYKFHVFLEVTKAQESELKLKSKIMVLQGFYFYCYYDTIF